MAVHVAKDLSLYENSLFYDLSKKGLADVMGRMRPIEYHAGDLIFQEGSPSIGLYIVVSGMVYFAKQCGQLNRQRILKILGPGDIAGEEAIFNSEIASCPGHARALTDVRIAFLEKSSVMQLLVRYPKFAKHLCEWLARELRIFECKLAEQSYQPLQKNLLRLLLTLMSRFGSREPEGIMIEVNLSRQDWADLLGAHIDTVVHELSKLREQGLICFRDHQIIILDEAMLRQMLDQETTCMKESLY